MHIGGHSGMIGVIVSEQKPADLRRIDAVLLDIAQDLIGLAVTADAGVNKRELIAAVDDIHMAVKRV